MRPVTERWARTCAVMLMLASGCAPADEDAPSLDCSTLSRTFFRKSTKQQIADFDKLDVESQYAAFICGNQEREPPAIYLAKAFANEGGAVVGFLKAKLATARGDLTIHDIVLVFQHMSRGKTYKVAGDIELMKVLEDAVARVKDPFWRQRCEQGLSEIRQQTTAAP